MSDSVRHPNHYTARGIIHDSCGEPIECINIVKYFDFPLGSAIKYIWRNGLKDPDKAIEDLEKSKQNIEFAIDHLKLERARAEEKEK